MPENEDTTEESWDEDEFEDETNPISAINKISSHIYTKKKKEFEILIVCKTLLSTLYGSLPNVYTTKDGHEIEDVGFSNPSKHDASRHILSLVIGEYHELFNNLMIGSFNSAVRSIKEAYEWVIRIVCALTDLSVITSKKSDLYTPGCFFAFMEIYKHSQMRDNVSKFESQSFLKIIDQEKQIGSIDEHDELLLKTELDLNVRNFINKFNSLIYENIELNKIETKETITGKNALLYLISKLENYPYNNPEKILKKHHDMPSDFDEDAFDNAFSLIIVTTDVILSLMLIMMDFDVFHGNKEWKKRRREEIQKLFIHKIDLNQFPSINALFKGETWNSVPPKDFVI